MHLYKDLYNLTVVNDEVVYNFGMAEEAVAMNCAVSDEKYTEMVWTCQNAYGEVSTVMTEQDTVYS